MRGRLRDLTSTACVAHCGARGLITDIYKMFLMVVRTYVPFKIHLR